jgi:hypothetical protein
LFIWEQGSGAQEIRMKMFRSLFYPVAIIGFCLTLPTAVSAGKDSRKPEPAANSASNCKQAVRATGETAPLRRGECPKVRRILM